MLQRLADGTVQEVILATNECKNMVSEGYLTFDEAPDPGTWGCEKARGNTSHAGAVETSEHGVIRVQIINVDQLVNGRYVYLVPAAGGTAMTAPDDLGNGVRSWLCGSDWPLARASLPAGCRMDTTTYASQDFE